MRTRLFLLPAFVLASSALLAADPPKFEVPKTWEKVVAGGSPNAVLVTRDQFTIWSDKVLVPETARNRAQSFTETLYRLKVGDKEPEKLEQVVTTHGRFALLGPAGEVAAGWFADCKTLYIPGLKPILMPKDVRYAAHQFTTDGLVCVGERYVLSDRRYEHTVLRFPIDRAKNELGEAKVLRPWTPDGADGFTPDFSHGSAFVRGDFVAQTGTVPDPMRTKRPGYTKPATEVWDIKKQAVAWREEVTAEAADADHVYWFPTADTVARRRLDGTAKAEGQTLPKEIVRLEVRPPHLFALVKQDKEWVLTRFDLSTGDRTGYDLRLPDIKPVYSHGGGGPTRVFVVMTSPSFQDSRLPLAIDAATGEVRVLHDGSIYRIPAGKKVAADAKPKWEPLPEEK